jgi:hypothetical protein
MYIILNKSGFNFIAFSVLQFSQEKKKKQLNKNLIKQTTISDER